MSSIVNKVKDTVTGSGFFITNRPTPTPGPNELLTAVKSIALNPIDFYQRDYGFPPINYPAVIGYDIAGTVLAAGSSVPSSAPKPGTRVAALAVCFYMQGAPDYGALQTRVLVPAVNAVPLPDGMSFTEASLLPIAITTVWGGWYTIGVARDTKYTAADKKGMLVWGGASSIGSAAVQVARVMGFHVYVTASEKHHEYLKGLGARRGFDYKSEDVVERIVRAAKEDGVTVDLGFDAVGQIQSCLEVLKKAKGPGTTARLAEATPLNEDSPTTEGVEVKFMAPPSGEEERSEFCHFVFGVWLKEKLAKGEFVPSPKIQVVEGGLEGASKALDILSKGVSGVKLVLEV
ncbi:hypothetical protein MMC30_004345 [Trapelia coarctata]|nr:hypothetical protein [Trapelia coarctata]